jgi:hypothetical protein
MYNFFTLPDPTLVQAKTKKGFQIKSTHCYYYIIVEHYIQNLNYKVDFFYFFAILETLLMILDIHGLKNKLKIRVIIYTSEIIIHTFED